MAFLQQVFTVPSMVSGSSLTSSVEIPGSYLYMYLVIPTMTGGFAADTSIMLQGSGDNSTFYRFSNPESNTTPIGANDFIIKSSATQRMVYIPNFAFRYVKVETTAVATAGITSNAPFKFICVSEQ